MMAQGFTLFDTAIGHCAIAWGEQFARKPWTIDKDGYASIPHGPGRPPETTGAAGEGLLLAALAAR